MLRFVLHSRMRRFEALVAVALASVFALAENAPRKFTFDYSISVRNPNPGKKLRVWIPLAQSDVNQTVRVVFIAGDLPLRKTQEAEYGNAMLYASAPRADRAEYKFTVKYEVTRREYAVIKGGVARQSPMPAGGPAQLARFLEPDKLAPITGLPSELAAQSVRGRKTGLDRARAIYEYVFNNMRYDKSGSGWGRGDTLYACDARHGNCTDFHSLFISMARSQKIPARFEIGFSIPGDKSSAEVAGYHCWSEFYLEGTGWVPVDISEAWKRPEMKNYFFGAHDANRMQFSIGRDLKLNPAQEGERVNYFVYPYVEMDGKAYSNVALNFRYAESAPKQRAAQTKARSAD